ncbi:PP2C family protein-serine/threonine phosphatase [Leptospira idonii]|uniref:Serine/threonine-protein phosphatase n=1 Tax=Leptospira idonii TaxID=1193500 RepID=A0A4R9M098_9LEPT|nr:PP2C family protein-serine/threonine phosphatase [Leptospira idonii]TGN19452.1 serine/threonine-protein phosphatase [Leptospira idonii]
MDFNRRKSDQFKLDEEVLKISRICLAVFTTFIGFGIFAPVNELGMYDPKWMRAVHSGITFLFFLLTFFSSWVRHRIQPIMLVFFYTMSAHSLILLYWNSLYVGYLIGMILVLSCIGVSFVERKWLVHYLGSVTSVGILIGIYTKEPMMDLSLYLSAILTPAIISYLTLNVRLGSVEKLRESESQLKHFHDRISSDLDMARDTQNNLVTTDWPKIEGCKFTSFFRSFDQVGGDAISYKIRPDGTVAIFFADVSGHGIASAMVSAMAVLAFNIHAVAENEPASCLLAMHEDLKNLVPNNHISAVIVYYSPTTKTIAYSYAGHPLLLLMKSNQTNQFLEGSGTLIVSMLEPRLKNNSKVLESGDKLLFYSDGIVEVNDAEGELFGDENLIDTVTKYRSRTGIDFLNSLFEDVIRFSDQKFSDDMSMLLIEFE